MSSVIEKFASTFSNDNKVKKTISQTNNVNNSQKTIEDNQKSHATAYMIGATAVASVIALGIAGRKGYLGKSAQEFLGGVSKNKNTVPKKQTATVGASSNAQNTTSASTVTHSSSTGQVHTNAEKKIQDSIPQVEQKGEIQPPKGESKVAEEILPKNTSEGVKKIPLTTPTQEVKEYVDSKTGNIIKETIGKNEYGITSKCEHVYPEGSKTAIEARYYHDDNKTIRNKFEYRPDGTRRKHSVYNKEGNLASERIYDEKGNPIEEIKYDNNKFVSRTPLVKPTQTSSSYVDKKTGNTIEETIMKNEYGITSKYERVYPEGSKTAIEARYYHDDNKTIRNKFEYRPDGTRRKFSVYNEKGSLTSEKIYNEKGDPVEEIKY